MKPYLLTPFFCCVFSTTLVAQIPSNNDTAGTIALAVTDGSCDTKTAGTLVNATDSEAGGTPSCGFGLNSDVWYAVEVPASGNLAIETHNVVNTYFNSVLTVYSGTPAMLTEQACDDNDGIGSLSKVILANQTAGATLYVRVWGFDGDRFPFEICVREPDIPENNDITDAESLTVSNGSCSTKTAGTF